MPKIKRCPTSGRCWTSSKKTWKTGSFSAFGSFFACVFGTIILVWPWISRARQDAVLIGKSSDSSEDRLIKTIKKLPLFSAHERSALQTLLLGVVMGFLPCMITLWVLGLAVSTASPVYGALLMLCLVLLTTPVITVCSLAPRLLPVSIRKKSAYLARIGLWVSGVWLLLIGLAGFEIIDHAHWMFEVRGEEYMIMFW